MCAFVKEKKKRMPPEGDILLIYGKLILVEVVGVHNLTVLGINCENTTNPIGLIVPVTGSDFDGNRLTCERCKERILVCTGAVKADRGAAICKLNIGVIAVDGKCFKRYLEISKILGNKVAVITDNDKNYIDNITNILSVYKNL